VVVGAAGFDRTFEVERRGSGTRESRNLATIARQFGEPINLGAALFLGYFATRALHRPDWSGNVVRVGGSIVVAGAATEAIKLAVGRYRPFESQHDSHRFAPFSGHDSFPSGHVTLAFAAAGAVDHETSARWVPWVVYPLAVTVCWSRVRDDEHWTSDVAAGAAIGYWFSVKTDRVLRHHRVGEPGGVLRGASAFLLPERDGVRGGLLAAF
jgi:membrane-associated phospholipid phosphatase